MIRDLVIIGAGGFGREASLLVEEINSAQKSGPCWKLIGFIDEDQGKWGKKMRGYPVLGASAVTVDLPANTCYISAIGEPAAKKRSVTVKEFRHKKFINLIHPDVTLSPDVQLGCGVIINRGSILTTAIGIGNHVSLNPGCGIGHDALIGDYTTLLWRVNISGNVKVGRECLIGTGATILQGLALGDRVIIGAGAVVTKNIPGDSTAVGVPARFKDSKAIT